MAVYREWMGVAGANRGSLVTRASAALPQTAAGNLFTLAGGLLVITGIVGKVTTAIQNQANNTKLVYSPDVGADVDLCSALNIANDPINTVYCLSGTVANAMRSGYIVMEQTQPFIVGPGTVDLDCAASNTGEVQWTLAYFALEDGVTVVAA